MPFFSDIWHPFFQRLWRPTNVTYIKSKGQKSNAHYSWTCLQRKINKIIDLSTPQNQLQSHISMWDTLSQHDGVRTTMKKKVHPKFFQNLFLGCPWVVWLGIRTWSAIESFYLIKSLHFLEKITNLLLIATMKKA